MRLGRVPQPQFQKHSLVYRLHQWSAESQRQLGVSPLPREPGDQRHRELLILLPAAMKRPSHRQMQGLGLTRLLHRALRSGQCLSTS